MHYQLAAILYNPKSTGDSERLARKFAKRLERAKIADEVRVVATKYRSHAEELVGELSAKYSPLYIVSSSGDGGYNEVVNGAMRSLGNDHRIVTGLLPSGNANDHYKSVHKPYVIRQLRTNKPREVDVLQINTVIKGRDWQRFAHSYIGFGISSSIGKALNEIELTPAKEIIVTAKAFLEFEAFEAKVDGKKQLFQSILVSNVGKMSKYLKISKHARVNDGKFEVITATADKAKLISTLVKSATVGVSHEKQTSSITFQAVSVLPVQLDGEVFTIDAGARVRVSIAKQKLRCII